MFGNPSRTGDLPHRGRESGIKTFDSDCDAVLVFKSGGRDLDFHAADCKSIGCFSQSKNFDDKTNGYILFFKIQITKNLLIYELK